MKIVNDYSDIKENIEELYNALINKSYDFIYILDSAFGGKERGLDREALESLLKQIKSGSKDINDLHNFLMGPVNNTIQNAKEKASESLSDYKVKALAQNVYRVSKETAEVADTDLNVDPTLQSARGIYTVNLNTNECNCPEARARLKVPEKGLPSLGVPCKHIYIVEESLQSRSAAMRLSIREGQALDTEQVQKTVKTVMEKPEFKKKVEEKVENKIVKKVDEEVAKIQASADNDVGNCTKCGKHLEMGDVHYYVNNTEYNEGPATWEKKFGPLVCDKCRGYKEETTPNLGPKVEKPLSELSIYELARRIRIDWKNVNYAAKPYLDAMRQLDSIDDMYGLDDGRSIVLYFLSNAATWRGPVAQEIKAELKRRLAEPIKRKAGTSGPTSSDEYDSNVVAKKLFNKAFDALTAQERDEVYKKLGWGHRSARLSVRMAVEEKICKKCKKPLSYYNYTHGQNNSTCDDCQWETENLPKKKAAQGLPEEGKEYTKKLLKLFLQINGKEVIEPMTDQSMTALIQFYHFQTSNDIMSAIESKLKEKGYDLSKELPPKKASEDKELKMGIEAEKEHADVIKWIKTYYKENGKWPADEDVFAKIAKAHLKEFKDYYTRLKAMEEKAKAERKAKRELWTKTAQTMMFDPSDDKLGKKIPEAKVSGQPETNPDMKQPQCSVCMNFEPHYALATDTTPLCKNPPEGQNWSAYTKYMFRPPECPNFAPRGLTSDQKGLTKQAYVAYKAEGNGPLTEELVNALTHSGLKSLQIFNNGFVIEQNEKQVVDDILANKDGKTKEAYVNYITVNVLPTVDYKPKSFKDLHSQSSDEMLGTLKTALEMINLSPEELREMAQGQIEYYEDMIKSYPDSPVLQSWKDQVTKLTERLNKKAMESK